MNTISETKQLELLVGQKIATESKKNLTEILKHGMNKKLRKSYNILSEIQKKFNNSYYQKIVKKLSKKLEMLNLSKQILIEKQIRLKDFQKNSMTLKNHIETLNQELKSQTLNQEELKIQLKNSQEILFGAKKKLKKLIKIQDAQIISKAELKKLINQYKELKEILAGKKIEADNLKQLASEVINQKHILQ